MVEKFKKFYLGVFTQNYLNFKGRAGLAEYWYFVLFNFVIQVILGIIDSAIGLKSILVYIYALGVLLPALGLTVRRLHDIGKSGWFILVSLIPIVGAIWLIVLLVKKGDPKDNEFGPALEAAPAPAPEVKPEPAPAPAPAPEKPAEPEAPAEKPAE